MIGLKRGDEGDAPTALFSESCGLGVRKGEIIRRLKRYLAREVFLLLPAPVVSSHQLEAA